MKYTLASKYGWFGKLNTFIQLDNQGAVQVLDPSKATLFASKKEAEAWLEKNIPNPASEGFVLISEKELKDKIKQFEEFVKKGKPLERMTLIDPSMNAMFDPEKHDVYDVMDWMYRYVTEYMEDKVSYDTYLSWDHVPEMLKDSAFCEFKVFLHDDIGVIGQMIPVFKVTIDFPFEQFEKEITYLIEKYPFLKHPENGFVAHVVVSSNVEYYEEEFVLQCIDEEQWHAYETRGEQYKGTLKECYNGIMDCSRSRGLY